MISVILHYEFYYFILDPGITHSNHPCLSAGPSVGLSVGPSVFKYLGDCSLVFPETLHEVWGQ